MCQLFKFLYGLIPIRKFQSYLIKKHFSSCSFCKREIEVDASLKEIFAIPDWVKGENLWPQIRPKLYSPEEKVVETKGKFASISHKRWQWAVAGLALAAAIGINLLIQQSIKKGSYAEDASLSGEKARIVITRAEINGKEARPYIYQTPTASFVWFAKSEE